ncbi:hypothetical protein CCH79_00013906, partial [Gambusia affinis]
MAVGKNKRLTKGGKKGAKKKIVDPFSKKDWYDVKAPAMFNIRNIGKTLVTRTQGTRIASDGLKGRVFEVSLADLQNDEVAFRKFKLVTEDVQGKNCLTNFHGMDLTRDKMCSMVKKWQHFAKKEAAVSIFFRGFCVVSFSSSWCSATIGEQQDGAAGCLRGTALYSFTSDCEEELSLQVGDIVTNLESVDGEWFLGDLRGKRALVPKNYLQVLD